MALYDIASAGILPGQPVLCEYNPNLSWVFAFIKLNQSSPSGRRVRGSCHANHDDSGPTLPIAVVCSFVRAFKQALAQAGHVPATPVTSVRGMSSAHTRLIRSRQFRYS